MKRALIAVSLLFMILGGCRYDRNGAVESLPAPEAAKTEDVLGAAEHEPASGAMKALRNKKIIRTASIQIDSSDIDGDLEKIESRVSGLGGYIHSSTQDRRSETYRSARIVVKIPSGGLDGFLGYLEGAFKVEQLSTDSQDVTEDYFDVEARLNNAKRQEKRLLELLENQTGKLEDVLNVERELARAREYIETMEGKIRYYDNRVNLSTVTIDLSQSKPAREVGENWFSNFGGELKRTLAKSIKAIGGSIQALVIILAAALPWLIMFYIAFKIVKFTWRRRKKRT